MSKHTLAAQQTTRSIALSNISRIIIIIIITRIGICIHSTVDAFNYERFSKQKKLPLKMKTF
ncbi:hypothetical protein HUJ04_010296 [Dendroctonus ponderosae]|nr:hypothetical protein HUJ04_010296 [Dendroctonus ponderosae]